MWPTFLFLSLFVAPSAPDVWLFLLFYVEFGFRNFESSQIRPLLTDLTLKTWWVQIRNDYFHYCLSEMELKWTPCWPLVMVFQSILMQNLFFLLQEAFLVLHVTSSFPLGQMNCYFCLQGVTVYSTCGSGIRDVSSWKHLFAPVKEELSWLL